MKLELPKVGQVWIDKYYRRDKILKLNLQTYRPWIETDRYQLSFLNIIYEAMIGWGFKRCE